MGVPFFFRILMDHYKHKKILLANTPDRAKRLYIDTNGIMHPNCFKLLKYFPDETNIEKLEDKMMKRIIEYIKYLIGYVNPSEYVYIAVDGVAPLAKASQQRKRRYRSVDDAKMKNELMRKYKIPHNENWSNIVITPGTEFMEKLHQKLLHFSKTYKGCKIVYSSYHTHQEGEHKLLQDIKMNPTSGPIVINGLDADLIFLSLSSGQDNIYLLRESTELGINKIQQELFDPVTDVAEDLTYVSIDRTKEAYNEHMRSMIKDKGLNIRDDVCFLEDYVFICYLLGNDFLPHFPTIEIKKGGYDAVINSYVDVFISAKKHIISRDEKGKIKIDTLQLYLLIKMLGDIEERFFHEIYPDFLYKESRKRCNALTDYERELWEIENMRNIKIDDPIRLGVGDKRDWKFRYYEYYFGGSEHQQEIIDDLCKNYLEGLKWVTEYYFDKCCSWRWQYKYLHAPFISDVAEYIIKNNIDLNKIVFESDKPIKMSDQLLSVIPPHHVNIIPNSLRQLMINDKSPIIDLFPIEVSLDMLYKDQLWKCIPLVPYLDIERIERETKNLQFKKEELIRLEMY